ncbi:MAG: cyclophilin family peptidyl-prolyl cis-trans isomerase [Maribacter sp.]|jgi:cyclophilin family peptidyl-prolyl cis-trans isomerase
MRKNIFFFIMISLFLASCAKPISDFTYNLEGKYAPAKVVFENKSEKADAYTWDFGDGNTSVEESPEHIYRESGNYTVKLMASKGTNIKAKEYAVFVPAPEECLIELSTDYGNMIIKLYDDTPKHRDNFVKLVEEGYYDDLLFHRVMKGFMIQGGDPDSKNAKKGEALGMGGPSYTIPAEFNDTLVHIKGALAAARNNNPQKKSSGSQFYIVDGNKIDAKTLDRMASRQGKRYSTEQRELYQNLGGTPQLDGEYTVFGMVIEGLDVIDKIAKVGTDGKNRPNEDVKIKMRVIK